MRDAYRLVDVEDKIFVTEFPTDPFKPFINSQSPQSISLPNLLLSTRAIAFFFNLEDDLNLVQSDYVSRLQVDSGSLTLWPVKLM